MSYLATVARLQRNPIATVLTRDGEGPLQECSAKSAATSRLGNDQVRDPRIAQRAIEPLPKLERQEPHHLSIDFGDETCSIRSRQMAQVAFAKDRLGVWSYLTASELTEKLCHRKEVARLGRTLLRLRFYFYLHIESAAGFST